MTSDPEAARSGPASAKWGDLGPRVASALVLIPMALAAIWRGGAPFAVFVALITVGLAVEWLGLCGCRRQVRAGLPFIAVPAAVLLPLFAGSLAALVVLALAGVAALIARPRHLPVRTAVPNPATPDAVAPDAVAPDAVVPDAAVPGDAVPGGVVSGPVPFGSGAFVPFASGIVASGIVALGIPYFGLPGVALVWLRNMPGVGLANVLVLLLAVWASDIGAYLVGRLVGGPLLAPAISPGKTWSGAAGGLLAAASAGLGAALMLGDARGWRACGTAVLIGVAAQLGDLLESRVKRFFGVKDSGSLIPGHGGLLDRLDAVLAAAPVAALLASTLPPGVSLWK